MKNCLIRILLISLIVSISLIAQSTKYFSVSGKITCKETEEPLIAVNVFVDGTTLGVATDKDGNYHIEKIPIGNYTIIASIIGFKVAKKEIEFHGKSEIVLDIALKETSYELPEVNINAEADEEWIYNYNRFFKKFIGESEFAKNCIIQNKEVIEFSDSREDNAFVAKAPVPLNIYNYSLGYQLKFSLNKFRCNRSGEVSYLGEVLFEEMDTTDSSIKGQWIENRRIAYNGSLKHFLVALQKNKLFEEGFLSHKTFYPTWQDQTKRDLPNPELSELVRRHSEWKRELDFHDFVKVTYLRKEEEKEFRDFRTHAGSKISGTLQYQVSWFSLPDGKLYFDNIGNIVDNYSAIKVYGYWGWTKVSYMLPKNYLPEE